MKRTGVIVDTLVKMDSETYKKHVMFDYGNKVIYGVVLRSICGILAAALLFYKKIVESWKISDLGSILKIHVLLTG